MSRSNLETMPLLPSTPRHRRRPSLFRDESIYALLPPELWTEVFFYLPVIHLLRAVRASCFSMNELVLRSYVWSTLLERDFAGVQLSEYRECDELDAEIADCYSHAGAPFSRSLSSVAAAPAPVRPYASLRLRFGVLNLVERPVKIVLLGDLSCGKTALVRRKVDGTFVEDENSTIGIEFASVTHSLSSFGGVDVSLHLWDTSGDPRFRSLVPVYARRTEIIILMFDRTEESFRDCVRLWEEALPSNLQDKPSIACLVQNKVDLPPSPRWKDGTEIASVWAEEQGLTFFQISCKTNENVSAFFDLVTKSFVEWCLQNHVARSIPETDLVIEDDLPDDRGHGQYCWRCFGDCCCPTWVEECGDGCLGGIVTCLDKCCPCSETCGVGCFWAGMICCPHTPFRCSVM